MYHPYEVYVEKHVAYWRWIVVSLLLAATIGATTITYKTLSSVKAAAPETRMPSLQIVPAQQQPQQQPAATVIAPVADRSKEVQAKLEAWVAAQQGSEWGLYIRSLDNDALQAGVQTGKQFSMASIYKLFLLKPLADTVPAEAWANNQITGKSYQDCVHIMLAVSDNPCAEAIAGRLGWSMVQKQLTNEGYRSTIINDTENFVTTAADTGLLLERLYEGEGYDAKTKEITLNAMGQYKRAEAIRRACDGCRVMNKTGDLAGAKHDAGIVIKDGKAYVVVILSKDATWNKLAEAAAAITAEL